MANKNQREMTQEESAHQDKKTMVKAFFIVIPSMFLGFYITFFITDIIWESFNHE
jgi:hypothetical protein